MNIAYLFDLEIERREHLGNHFNKMGINASMHSDIPASKTEEFSDLLANIPKKALVLIHKSIRQKNHELLAKKLLFRKTNLVIFYSGSYQGENEIRGNLLIWGAAIGLMAEVNWHITCFYEKLNGGCMADICFKALISGCNFQEANQWNKLLNEIMYHDNFTKDLLYNERFDEVSKIQIIREQWEILSDTVMANIDEEQFQVRYLDAIKDFRSQTKHLFE